MLAQQHGLRIHLGPLSALKAPFCSLPLTPPSSPRPGLVRSSVHLDSMHRPLSPHSGPPPGLNASQPSPPFPPFPHGPPLGINATQPCLPFPPGLRLFPFPRPGPGPIPCSAAYSPPEPQPAHLNLSQAPLDAAYHLPFSPFTMPLIPNASGPHPFPGPRPGPNCFNSPILPTAPVSPEVKRPAANTENTKAPVTNANEPEITETKNIHHNEPQPANTKAAFKDAVTKAIMPTSAPPQKGDSPSPTPLPTQTAGYTRPSLDATTAPPVQVQKVHPQPNSPGSLHVMPLSTSLSSPSAATSPPIFSSIETELDVYAPRYVPKWLREVNKSTEVQHIQFHYSSPVDFNLYAESFLPLPILRTPDQRWVVGPQDGPHAASLPQPTIQDDILSKSDLDAASTPLAIPSDPSKQQTTAEDDGEMLLMSTLSDVERLGPRNYLDRMVGALRIELAERKRQLDNQTLFAVRLERIYMHKTMELYEFPVPGLREDRPRLTPGDVIQLRPISTVQQRWWPIVFEASVYNLDTFRGVVSIRADGLSQRLSSWGCALAPTHPIQLLETHVTFNIVWQNAVQELVSAPLGISVVGAILRQNSVFQMTQTESKPLTMASQLLDFWLFPTYEEVAFAASQDERANSVDGDGQDYAADLQFRDSRLSAQGYYDRVLNEEQMQAVEYLARYRPRLPYLIDGPPGTGKTKTICEAALQILRRQPHATILLVAPSHTAADTLALRLAAVLHPDMLFRLNAPSRGMATVPFELLSFCHTTDIEGVRTVFGLPPVGDLLRKRVVVTTTVDCALLVKCRCTNADVQRLAFFTAPLTHARKNAEDPPLHWTHLLVDEAAQGTEAELTAAIACVLPAPASERHPTLALCGDKAQLGPRIHSAKASAMGLEMSLLERLLQEPIHRNALSELRARQKRQCPNPPVTIGEEDDSDQVFEGPSRLVCALRRNYRARHPALISVPSTLWYADTLLPAAPRSYDLLGWPGFPNPQIPIAFESMINSLDVEVDDGVSWHSKFAILLAWRIRVEMLINCLESCCIGRSTRGRSCSRNCSVSDRVYNAQWDTKGPS